MVQLYWQIICCVWTFFGLIKILENHIGAIWYFIHDYNSRIATVWAFSLLSDHYPKMEEEKPVEKDTSDYKTKLMFGKNLKK